MEKRMIAAFAMTITFFAVLLGQLALISGNKDYAAAAWRQCDYEVQVGDNRGNIYDCNLHKLTGTQEVYYALASPGDASYHTLFSAVNDNRKAALYQKAQEHQPFLISLQAQSTEAAEYLYAASKRYTDTMPACHLIGYLNGEGNGVSGVEAAFDNILANSGTTHTVRCATTAWGTFIDEYLPHSVYTQGSGEGVVLTIDSILQAICEGAAAEMDSGSIVVMECATGRIRACVSMPQFNPNDIAASIEKKDTSLVNRTISQYIVGSVFKPLVAASALQNYYDKNAEYYCTGSIEVDGHVYSCAGKTGHGAVDMQTALEKSCNCYFINLGLQLGGKAILDTAKAAGFGRSTLYAGQLRTAAGNLPTVQQLQNSGQLASISFGQGELLATPLQIAAYMKIFANDGKYISPTLVEGVLNENTMEIEKSLYTPMQRQVVSAYTAQTIRKMLVSTVENGIAKDAMPTLYGAGGKTGTAQTGRFNEAGEEELDAWFAGFYPAENPQYTIAILMDSGRKTSEDACVVFRHIADALSFFQ